MSDWTSVEDGLPADGLIVIAAEAGGDVSHVAYHVRGLGWHVNFIAPGYGPEHEITHWQPLPLPPEEGDA